MRSLGSFLEELPSAVLAYSLAICAFSIAAILFRAALHLYFGV